MTKFDPTVRTEQALAEVQERFDANLTEAEPLFMNLARDIDVSAGERRWQALIGEDCSGRPVTRFVSSLLRGMGMELPVLNLCTSETTRRFLGPQPFHEAVGQFAINNGKPQNVLVVTEKITTGATAAFLSGVLRPHFISIDFAILASRYNPVPEVDADRLFLGGAACGTGEDEIVYKTFEGIVDIDTPEAANWRRVLLETPEEDIPALFQKHHIRTSTSYPLHGLVASETSPFAIRVDDEFYNPLIEHVEMKMDDLATSYLERRD